jgi:hypothetical protein
MRVIPETLLSGIQLFSLRDSALIFLMLVQHQRLNALPRSRFPTKPFRE